MLFHPNRVLVVGGTGMLGGVSLSLAERGAEVLILSRNAGRFGRLQRQVSAACHGRLEHLPADYHRFKDPTTLPHALFSDPFDLAVFWVHSTATGAPTVLADALFDSNEQSRVVEVLGSASSRVPGWSQILGREKNIHQRVVLGFEQDPGQSRWLTHGEICAGVLDAIDSGRDRTVVGQIEPWYARP